MRIGALRHRVVLDDPVPDGTQPAFAPRTVSASLEPGSPGAFDEQRVTYFVRMRYHPQVTMNTRVTTQDGRQLFVRGIQNVDNRNIELVLLCQEVQTP
jgi:hypothetical protein